MIKTPRIRLIKIVYWFMLIYVVAALVWWFIALQKQNNTITTLLTKEAVSNGAGQQKIEQIQNEKQRKITQYVGEGFTFLILIIIGAVFVYRATRRQLRLSMQQQNFMMAVTHELKTPIAVAQLNIETLIKRKLDEHQQKKIINTTLLEVNRLNTLCNNILLASQLDAGKYNSVKTKIDLSALTIRVINDFAERFTDRTILSDISDDIYVLGEGLLLEILLSNLIDNALKYSPKETMVDVQLNIKNDEIQLTIADEGSGITDSEKQKIFGKFYRVGNEETRTAKGTGLGLYLCNEIAKDHNAIISVKDNENKGSIFSVIFKNQML